MMNIDELINQQSDLSFSGFYAAIIWLILWLTSNRDQNVTLKWHVLILLSMILAGATTLALEIQNNGVMHISLFIEKLQDLETTYAYSSCVNASRRYTSNRWRLPSIMSNI